MQNTSKIKGGTYGNQQIFSDNKVNIIIEKHDRSNYNQVYFCAM